MPAGAGFAVFAGHQGAVLQHPADFEHDAGGGLFNVIEPLNILAQPQSDMSTVAHVPLQIVVDISDSNEN